MVEMQVRYEGAQLLFVDRNLDKLVDTKLVDTKLIDTKLVDTKLVERPLSFSSTLEIMGARRCLRVSRHYSEARPSRRAASYGAAPREAVRNESGDVSLVSLGSASLQPVF